MVVFLEGFSFQYNVQKSVKVMVFRSIFSKKSVFFILSPVKSQIPGFDFLYFGWLFGCFQQPKNRLCALRRLTAAHPYACASGLPSAGASILATTNGSGKMQARSLQKLFLGSAD